MSKRHSKSQTNCEGLLSDLREQDDSHQPDLAFKFEKLIRALNHTKPFLILIYQTNSLKIVVGLDLLILDQPGTSGFALPVFENKSNCSSQKDQNHPSNNHDHDHRRGHPR